MAVVVVVVVVVNVTVAATGVVDVIVAVAFAVVAAVVVNVIVAATGVVDAVVVAAAVVIVDVIVAVAVVFASTKELASYPVETFQYFIFLLFFRFFETCNVFFQCILEMVRKMLLLKSRSHFVFIVVND